MRRRDFIRNTALAASAVSMFPLMAHAKGCQKIGLNLWTVRDMMNKDVAGTLDLLAEIGYKWIEPAGYDNGLFYGTKPSKFKQLVDDRGMEIISNHTNITDDNKIDETLDAVVETGAKYAVLPLLRDEWEANLDGLKKAAEFLNIAGEKAREKGIKFGFHNHTFEFSKLGNTLPIDVLMAETDPKLVTFEMDLAWTTAAGKDPIEFFKKYPGRFELWHVKDTNKENEDEILGLGRIDFKAIFEEKKLSGMKYFFVEKDYARNKSVEEILKINMEYLRNNIF